ncbi:MAG: hypothetical protein HY078_03475 [Elusimicrobia bacterium]|nr:hypothetical protein [Elusimicrobiota bacterium]
MEGRLRLLALVLPLFTICSIPAWCDPDDEAAQSHWTVPSATPAPGANAAGDYAEPDRRRMAEQPRRGLLDQACRAIHIKTEVAAGVLPRAVLGIDRRLQPDLDGSLALIDEESVSVSINPSEAIPLGTENPTARVWAVASASGKSIVVSRLGTYRSCEELQRLVDVRGVKFAFPFTAKRIAAMERGELWRIPLTFQLGCGVGAAEAFAGRAILSLGYSQSKNGTASMTLWRRSEKSARFRLRIDLVEVRGASLGAQVSMTPLAFASLGENALARLADRAAASQLAKYAAASLGAGSSTSDGHKLVLEHVLDPTDPAQAEALAEALRGNLLKLANLARLATTHPEESYSALRGDTARQLGAATYAARSEYGRKAESFSINLPFLFQRTVSETFGPEKVTRINGDGGQLSFHTATRVPNNEYFNAPFVGPIVQDQEQRTIDVITHTPTGKPSGDPFAVYIHNQSFRRIPESSVRAAVEDANSILRLAGAARTGHANGAMQLPVRSLMPAPPATPSEHGEPADRKGRLSFTLVMNQKAVSDALAASTQEVLQAFARSMAPSDRTMAEWLARNGRLEGTRLVYDVQRARTELGFREETNDAGWLERLSRQAAGLALDLKAAVSGGPEDRARALSRAFSHESRSGLAHRDVLRVLVQFMDPLDLTGDFVAAVDGAPRKTDNINARLVLKKDRAEVPMLKEAGQTRARFSDGSVLTD